MIPTPVRVEAVGRCCWYVWLFERPRSGLNRYVRLVVVPHG